MRDKEFEVTYEAFDYFFKKEMEIKTTYVKACTVDDAKEIALFRLGNVDIISVEELYLEFRNVGRRPRRRTRIISS